MISQTFSALTVGEVAASIRDLSIFSFIAIAGWKSRALFQVIKDFFDRIERHMDTMENFAQVVVQNHLRHIEADLKVLSGRKDDLPPEAV